MRGACPFPWAWPEAAGGRAGWAGRSPPRVPSRQLPREGTRVGPDALTLI